MNTWPPVSVSRPAMQCMSVDLPEPDGPMTAVKWPAASRRRRRRGPRRRCRRSRRPWWRRKRGLRDRGGADGAGGGVGGGAFERTGRIRRISMSATLGVSDGGVVTFRADAPSSTGRRTGALAPEGSVDRGGRSATRGDEARLVRQHDRLHPIAEPQLHQHAADVGLHRRLAQHERRRRSRRSTARGRRDPAPRARGRSASPAPAARRAGTGRCDSSSMSRRVHGGASSASPPATTRMARTRSSGGVSFSRKPLAPLRSAAYT